MCMFILAGQQNEISEKYLYALRYICSLCSWIAADALPNALPLFMFSF